MAASAPTAKRLACDRCHSKKIRCSVDSSETGCGRCLQQNLPCTFSPPAKTGRPVRSKSAQTVPRPHSVGLDAGNMSFASMPLQPDLPSPDMLPMMDRAMSGSSADLFASEGSVSSGGRSQSAYCFDAVPQQAQQMLELMSEPCSMVDEDHLKFETSLAEAFPPNTSLPSAFSLPTPPDPAVIGTETHLYSHPNNSQTHASTLGDVIRELTAVHQSLCETNVHLSTSQGFGLHLDGQILGDLIHLTERTCDLICPFFFPAKHAANPPLLPSLDYASALFFIGTIVRAVETYELIAISPEASGVLDKLHLSPRQLASELPSVTAAATARGIPRASLEQDGSGDVSNGGNGGSPSIRIGAFTPSEDLGKWLMVNTMLYQICMLERLLTQMRFCLAAAGTPASVVQLLDELAVKSGRVKEGIQGTMRPVLDRRAEASPADMHAPPFATTVP